MNYKRIAQIGEEIAAALGALCIIYFLFRALFFLLA